jgi:hypothetical protein
MSRHADENGNTSLGLGVGLILQSRDQVLLRLAEYHEAKHQKYVKSGFKQKDAGGEMHKINAYARADGLAVYCRHCSTVDAGFACIF